jgi:outer membrane protein
MTTAIALFSSRVSERGSEGTAKTRNRAKARKGQEPQTGWPLRLSPACRFRAFVDLRAFAVPVGSSRIGVLSRLQGSRSLGFSSFLCALSVFVLAVPSFAADSAGDLLTLEQALAIALEHSPRLRAQDAAVSQARGAVREARSAGLPNASLQPSATVQGPQAAIQIPHGPSETVQPGQTGQVGVSGQIPLDLNGRVRASTHAARRGEAAAVATEDAERQAVIRDVADAYLDALEADELAAVATAQASQAELRRRFASVRLAAGTVTGLEALAADTDLANAREAQIAADTSARQARGSLNILLGRSPDTPVRLERPPAAEPGSAVQAAARAAAAAGPEESVRALQKVAEQERPDLHAAASQVAQARESLRSARAARLPGLGLSWSYLVRRPATLFGGYYWSVGLSVLQTLFDGGKISSQIAQARATLAQRQALQENTRLQVANQVRNAWLQLRSAGQQVEVAEAQEAQTAETARQAGVSYNAGTRTALDLATAQTGWLNAHAQAVRARYEAARARVAVAYATGSATAQTAQDSIK